MLDWFFPFAKSLTLSSIFSDTSLFYNFSQCWDVICRSDFGLAELLNGGWYDTFDKCNISSLLISHVFMIIPRLLAVERLDFVFQIKINLVHVLHVDMMHGPKRA